MVRKADKKNIIEKQICSKCGDSKRLDSEYYLASSDIIFSNHRLPICKDCLDSIIDFDNPYSVISAMRMIDRPFLKLEYDGAKQSNKGSAFREYMRRLAMRQNRNLTYAESQFENLKVNKDNEQTYDQEAELEIDPKLIKKWGRYSSHDLEYLENFYDEYAHNYATDTPVQINLYKNIAKVHLQAEKELYGNNTKIFKDLMELSSKLHNDGNIKPIQSTGANDDKGLSTYGLWIKTIEQEEPCEYFKDKSTYEDYDKFKKYIDNWFVRPFKNIFNISKDFNVKDD